MKIKKTLFIAVVLIVALLSTTAYASFNYVPNNAVYADAAARLQSLGIMNGDENGRFNPNNPITREEFAKVIVSASGLDETAGALKGSTVFPDVKPGSWSSGYINTAVSKNLFVGSSDGKFHPSDPVTYAQACTVLVKALGYNEADVAGLWPSNYIGKASNLGLTEGITLKAGDALPRWAAAMMIDKLLDTNMKKSAASNEDQTFADFAGLNLDNTYTGYSRPEVARNFDPMSQKLGSIDFSEYPTILKDSYDNTVTPSKSTIGESIKADEIKDYDVVYQVSDKNGTRRYILVVDNKINGKITSILPNKYSPKVVQIDNKDYDLSKYMNMNKINNTLGAFNIGDEVTALLGYDGQVVDIVMNGGEDNSNFALVLNNYVEKSTDITNYGSEVYYVKLLHTDGTTKTYRLNTSDLGLNGKLVKYKILDTITEEDYDTVQLQTLDYLNSKEYTIDKDRRKIDDSFAADNIKIFNLVQEIDNADSQAYVMNWSELPGGAVQPGKVKYLNAMGDFGDINVMLVDNIKDENYSLGLITGYQQKSGPQTQELVTTYNILINGQTYTWSKTGIAEYGKGSVVEVRLSGNKIFSLEHYVAPWAESAIVQAIDSRRIKLNDNIYEFGSDTAIYRALSENSFERIGTDDIEKGKIYGRVSVYLDKAAKYGGKARIVIIS